MPPTKKDDGGGTSVAEPGTATRPKVERPKMYKVILHNDDYTTMEFVVEILMTVFRRSKVEATRIMLAVHNAGKGVAGVYSKEVAEARCTLTLERARARGYPLLATTEPE